MASYSCKICLIYESKRNSTVVRHENQCKQKVKFMYICEKCGIFDGDKKSNMQKHESNCQVQCPECYGVFDNKRKLDEHKKYSIQFQPVPFVINNLQKKGLDKHMKTVHNSKISNKTVSMY